MKSCIDMDKFIAYLNKYISKEDREAVEQHLSNCDRCLGMFAMASQLSNDPYASQWVSAIEKEKPQETLGNIKNKIRVFYQWAKDQLNPIWINPLLQPVMVPVPVRSDNATNVLSENILIKRAISDLYAEMYFERSSANVVSMKMRVSKDNLIAPHVLIYIKRQGGGPAARPLKEPYVSFEGLSFGHYRISIEQDNIDKGEYRFEIKDNGIYGE